MGDKALRLENDQARRVGEAIRQHHERADGTGYPGSLKEAEQCIAGRILAVLDVYEALVHPRPFRDALVPPMGIEAIYPPVEVRLRDSTLLYVTECLSRFTPE